MLTTISAWDVVGLSWIGRLVDSNMSLVIVRLLVLLVAVCATSACELLYRMYAPPGVGFVSLPAGKFDNPDSYKVSPASHPEYRAKFRFSPPSPRIGSWRSRDAMVEIRPDDTWRVTHRIGGRWVVFSESYQLRQRQFLATANRFASPHVYHLLIDDAGRVSQGWLLLKSPLALISDTGRYENLDLDLRSTSGWPSEPLFEVHADGSGDHL